MKVEINSAIPASTPNVAASGTQKSPHAITSPQQDKWAVSSAYQQYLSTSATVSSASQARIEALTEQLRQDTSFSQYKRRNFINHPVGRELATEIILADEGLQEKIAKTMWETLSWTAHQRELPPSWRDINVKAMLLSSDELAQNSVLSSYGVVLNDKAATVGLNDTEKLLSAKAEDVDHANSTFDQKMDRVFDRVRSEFEANGMTFDENKSYSFYLDTSRFQFVVSGGTDEENSLIEKVLNTSNYTEDNLLATLGAIHNHRQEDGGYVPWMVDSLRCKDAIPVFGVVSVSVNYVQKMNQLYSAYERCRMDKELKAQYGFGIDDLEYRGGKIVGKTPEAQAVIDSDEGEFMKKTGYAYINLVKRYTGTPEFTDPIFVYENGKFQTTYQIFDEPCEGATNSAAIIANTRRKLAERESFFENGREGVLNGRSSGTKITQSGTQITQKNNLFQNLMQDQSTDIGVGKRFWDYPMGRELATQLILSSDDLLSKLAEMMWVRFASTPGMDDLFLPRGDHGFDVRAILNGSNAVAIDQVLRNYDVVLSQKARTTGLTKIERYLRQH
ncbi:MAG: hypothetical protein K2M42_00250 [Oscillospiraceae bacterium]|nr:hypothetical protein [Oscillospiraceae bacterium]